MPIFPELRETQALGSAGQQVVAKAGPSNMAGRQYAESSRRILGGWKTLVLCWEFNLLLIVRRTSGFLRSNIRTLCAWHRIQAAILKIT